MIQIEVFGIPRPGGSKIPCMNRRTGKLFVRPANPQTAFWRNDVQAAAMQQYTGALLCGPIFINYDFRFPRPKSHYRRGKLQANALFWHTVKPDLTKLIRSTEDALKNIVWHDDSQVCLTGTIRKRYCAEDEKPGVTIRIGVLES